MSQLKSVLLVDDDTTTNYLNKLLLTRLGIAEQLLVAENGRDALATLRLLCGEGAPDCPSLILLDINMPVMDGIEFLEAFKQVPWPQPHTMVIVLLTTSANSRELTRVQQLPVAATLTKPLTVEKIELVLHNYFGSR